MAFSLKFEGASKGGPKRGSGIASSAQTKDILSVVVTVALIAVVLFFFMKRQASKDKPKGGLITLSEEGETLNQGVLGSGGMDKLDELIRLLEGLQDISLDRDVLELDGYNDLNDVEQVISPPSRVGRPNPFIPIGFDPVSSVSSGSGGILDTNTEVESAFDAFFEEIPEQIVPAL